MDLSNPCYISNWQGHVLARVHLIGPLSGHVYKPKEIK